jgi:PAS domain S-box-containing protein
MSEYSKTKKELIVELEELKQKFELLEKEYASDLNDHKRIEFELNERMKELRCHNRISEVMSNNTLHLKEVYEKIVRIIPEGWQFPDVTEACIHINNATYQTANYKEGEHLLCENITVNGKVNGHVKVCLQDEQLPDTDQFFLPEESDLLFSIAERIGNFVEKKQYDSILAQSEEKYSKAFQTSPYAISIARVSDGKFIEVNDALIEITGFSHEEILNTINSRDLWLKTEDRNEVIEDLRQGKKVFGREYQFRNKQGEILTGLFSAQFITLNNEAFLLSSINDITSIKQTELERQESETLYKAIINASPDIITITDLNGTILFASPIALEMFGYRRNDELLKRNLIEIIAAEDRERAQSEIANMFQGNFAGADVYKAMKADKSIIHIEVNGQFIRDEKGTPTRMIFVIRDVSQRIKSEEALLKSEEKFKALFYYSPDGYLIIRDGKFVECNKAAESLIGGSKQQIIGCSPDQLSPELQPNGINSAQYVDELIKETYKKGENSFDWLHKRFDGSEVLFRINLTVITYEGEKVLFTTWRDITEQRKAEEKLRKIMQAVEQSPVSIVIADLDGNIEYVNPKACETTGYTEEELIGNNPRVLKSGETQKADYKELWDTISTGKNWHGVFHNKKKNGELYWESSTISPILDHEGKITHYLATKEDITDRKLADEELRKFRTISDLANYGNAISDLDGNLIYSNDAFANMHGYEVDEIVGHHLSMLHSEEQMIHVNEALDLLKKNGEFIAEEVWRTKKDGTIFPSLMNAKIIFDDKNNPQYLSASIIDISEIKETENIIRRSEEELNFAQELAKMGSWEFNVKTGEVSWSKNYYKLIGHDPSKPPLSLDEIKKIVHPDDRDLFESGITDIVKTHSLGSIYFRLIKTDGSFMWIQSNMVPNFENDELVSIHGVSIDITDKKEDEEKIRQQNIRLNAIIEAIPDFLFITDHEGNFLEFFNPDSSDLLIQEERIIGANFRDVFDAPNADFHIKMLNKCLNQNSLVTYEYSALTEETTKHFEARLVPFDDTRILIFVRNITKRKIQESEIRKLSLAVEQSPVLVVITDLNANIEYVNPAFEKATGYSEEELIGQNTSMLKSGKTDVAVYKNLWITIMQGKTWFGEWINKRKNGEFYWESVSITPIYDETGNITNYLGIKQDITARKKAEQEIHDLNVNLEEKIKLRTNQLSETNETLVKEIEVRKQTEAELIKAKSEADQANLAKSEFLSRMSHELRTPMNSILGFAQLLGMAELNPAQKKGVKHILKSGKHLLNLINEVLDISRIESGRISISLEPVQIRGAITEVIDIVQPLANQYQIIIERISSEVDLKYIKSDKQKLKQVLLNLLNNAIKYNRQAGSITVKTVDLEDVVRIEVSDTGLGISEENISKIFNPFERIGAEQTAAEGTGLGLAVVKKLMEAMGGNIGVESVLDKGSTFWIEFPVTESQHSIVEKANGKMAITKERNEMNGLVLYIEDNTSNIELVEQILSEQTPDIRMISEMNGKQGVKAATEFKPDLIFLDLNLPDMHGSKVLELLQENANTKHIPVVIISADAMPHQKQKLLNIGAKDYLTKPLDVYSFLRVVELWLKKKGLNPKTNI